MCFVKIINQPDFNCKIICFRWSMPFGGVATVLMMLATLFALAGHFNSDHKTLVASWLYILAGQKERIGGIPPPPPR